MKMFGIGHRNFKPILQDPWDWYIYLLGCPGTEVRINGERINGLFHLLINRVYWGYNPLILTFY